MLSGRAQFRKRAGLTQLRLGRLVGLSAATICLWENEEVELCQADVEKIARALEAGFNKVPVPSTREGIATALVGAQA